LFSREITLASRDQEERFAVQMVGMGNTFVQVIDNKFPTSHPVECSMSDESIIDLFSRLQLRDEGVSDLRPKGHVVETEASELMAIFIDEGAKSGGHDVRLENVCGGVDGVAWSSHECWLKSHSPY